MIDLAKKINDHIRVFYTNNIEAVLARTLKGVGGGGGGGGKCLSRNGKIHLNACKFWIYPMYKDCLQGVTNCVFFLIWRRNVVVLV